MKSVLNRKSLLGIVLSVAAGAMLALLLPKEQTTPGQTANPLQFSVPVPDREEEALRASYTLLQKEFATAPAQTSAEKQPPHPLLFFGLIRQNGQARALMAENPKAWPLSAYKVGEVLPGGDTLQKIGQDSIVVGKGNSTSKRIDLYPAAKSAEPASQVPGNNKVQGLQTPAKNLRKQ